MVSVWPKNTKHFQKQKRRGISLWFDQKLKTRNKIKGKRRERQAQPILKEVINRWSGAPISHWIGKTASEFIVLFHLTCRFYDCFMNFICFCVLVIFSVRNLSSQSNLYQIFSVFSPEIFNGLISLMQTPD